MNDTTIISVEDIKGFTSISDNIDVSQLEPFLMTSQDMQIRPILGDALMDDIIDDVATGGTQYQDLIDNWILKPLAYACWFNSAPFLAYKTMKKGVVTQNSDNSVNLTPEEMSIYIGRIEASMTFYLRRLKEYMDTSAAKELYPLYTKSDQINPTSSSSIFLGF